MKNKRNAKRKMVGRIQGSFRIVFLQWICCFLVKLREMSKRRE